MHTLLDVLASGVHDAKNQLFVAESLITAAETQYGVELGEARYAIEAAASRLSENQVRSLWTGLRGGVRKTRPRSLFCFWRIGCIRLKS